MSYCDRINCGYYYKSENDDYPCCHCEEPAGFAPCEYEEECDYNEEGE